MSLVVKFIYPIKRWSDIWTRQLSWLISSRWRFCWLFDTISHWSRRRSGGWIRIWVRESQTGIYYVYSMFYKKKSGLATIANQWHCSQCGASVSNTLVLVVSPVPMPCPCTFPHSYPDDESLDNCQRTGLKIYLKNIFFNVNLKLDSVLFSKWVG